MDIFKYSPHGLVGRADRALLIDEASGLSELVKDLDGPDDVINRAATREVGHEGVEAL